jgi:two-component system sensor kinase FixL
MALSATSRDAVSCSDATAYSEVIDKHWSTPIGALLLALCYYLGVHAGFALTPERLPVALLWPPNALLLAALLLFRRRAWPVLIAAVLPAHFLAEMSAAVPPAMVLGWFVSNVAEALIGALAIRCYLHRPPRLDCFRDLAAFLVGAGLFGVFLSSFLDAALVTMIGWRDSDYWTVWRTRLLSNLLATLTLVPLIVNWLQTKTRASRPWALLRKFEAGVLLAGLGTTCAIVFLRTSPPSDELMLLYLPLPFLVWAAMRFNASGVSLCVAIVAAFAISGVLQGRGPFTLGDPLADAMALQVFLIITAATLLLLSVALSELRNARRVAVDGGEQLQLALTAARMGIWGWELGSDRLTWSNPEHHAAARKRLFETNTTRMLERIHPHDRQKVVDAFAAALSGVDHVEVEFRWSHAGETNWIVAIGKLRSRGNARHVVGVHMNVSERKQQELQIQSQREQLAHLSRVAMLGELSGALAHELNQPLTAIMANVQAALRKAQDGSIAGLQEIFEDIGVENKRAVEVIRRLRALFVRRVSDVAPVNVNQCVRDVLSLGHSDLVARNVTAELRLAHDLPVVLADGVQLQQVLLNLVLNACDAMDENVPRDRYLRISTQLTEEGGVGIEVCDRGVGITDPERIFEPYFTTKHHGLGLGLAICQTIISAHRGRLWATNNSDRGATIHIELPVDGRPDARTRPDHAPGHAN